MINISDRKELRLLIAKYIQGKASKEEVEFLKKYYEYFDDEQDGIENLSRDERLQLKSQIYDEVRHKLESSHRSPVRFLWKFQAAAAILLFVIAGFIFWYSNSGDKGVEQDVVQEQLDSFVIDIAFGMAKHIYLPDGSYVVLEPGGQLKYSRGFNGIEREVYLDGQAYFDVQPDSLSPFLVHTKDVTTRVLGTAFSISSLNTNNEFSISVTRGKVEVTDQTHQLGILEKDDQLILDRVSQKVTMNKLRAEETAVIEPAEFMMNDMTVAEAMGIVEKRWGCKFDIRNNDLKNCRFTTYFTPTDDLEEVVAVIATVIGAEYSIKDKIVSLDGDGCD